MESYILTRLKIRLELSGAVLGDFTGCWGIFKMELESILNDSASIEELKNVVRASKDDIKNIQKEFDLFIVSETGE